jgi:hypothetical protein
MSIKLLFHCFAIASGIAAGGCALLSSNNKIVLFVVFSIIAAVFEVSIFFLKTPSIEIPKPEFSLISLPSNYSAGLEVYGIKWESDFKEYIFNFKNESNEKDLEDLRIELEMPGGIVTYAIESQEGCDDISFSQQYSVGGIADRKSNTIRKTFDYYVNNLKINLVRLFPKGNLSIRLIIKYLHTDIKGLFSLKCRYEGEDKNKVQKSLAYRILFRDKDKKTIYIDDSNLISGTYTASFLMVPKKPLVFRKNGSVQIKE